MMWIGLGKEKGILWEICLMMKENVSSGEVKWKGV